MKITPFVQKGFPMDSNNSNKFNLINLNSKTEEHIRSLYISNISETFLCLICWQINIIVRAYLNKVQWFNCQWQLADQFKISCKFYYPIYLETYFFYSCILYLIPNNFCFQQNIVFMHSRFVLRILFVGKTSKTNSRYLE